MCIRDSCSCRNIYVDGGLDYCHHGWEDEEKYLDMSEYLEENLELNKLRGK